MDMTLTERNIVLVAHILAAIITLGPATFAASAFPRAVLEGARDVARSHHRATRLYGTGTMAVPALGLYLATRMDYLGLRWVNLSIGLMLVALFILFLAVIPAQQRLLEAMEGEGFAADRNDVAKVRMASGLFSLAWVVILYLMVAKPM
jgi:hypothetical protein